MNEDKIKLLLVSKLDSISRVSDTEHRVVFRANYQESPHFGRIVLRVGHDFVRVDTTSTATNDFLGTADAYTRAADFMRSANRLMEASASSAV